MAEHTSHQKKIIERYYDNRDAIMLAKLGEIVTDLYLADSDAAAARLWKRAEKAMRGLGVESAVIERILARRGADDLARHLRDWLKPGGKAPPGRKGTRAGD